MLLAHWILLVGGLLPYVYVATAKWQRGYDNKAPRELAQYGGWRSRAYAAHGNAHEAFPLFAAAVLLATIRGADAAIVNLAAVVWLAVRVLHYVTYVKDMASARSLIWFAGTIAVIVIFGAALAA